MNLNRIAADLLRQAAQQPETKVQAKLERGLVLSVKRIDRQWNLAAARVDVYPSADEAVIIARTFGVPLGTEPEWIVRRQKTSLATLDWHGVVWTWLEDAPASHQPELIRQPAAYA